MLSRNLCRCAGLVLALFVWGVPSPAGASGPPAGECLADPGPPEYYKIDLVPTKRVPGARMAEGVGYVAFARSPFGIAVTPEGHYVYDLTVTVEGLRPPEAGAYVVWVATPDLGTVERLGVLDAAGRAKGRVQLNKFLVIVTLEPSAKTPGARWTGPVALRGLSKSGYMHTMAGHGPFEQEPCANYGY
jgi:hypothetical protein